MCPGDWRMISAMESSKVMVIIVLLVKLPIMNLARINSSHVPI